MKQKFKGKYRISSARASWWNYAWDGSYFVTICTRGRMPFFGQVKNGEMVLSETGQIATSVWQQIPDYFPYARLGEFVFMPNHLHGIVVIQQVNGDGENKSNPAVGTRLIASLLQQGHDTGGITGHHNPMLHQNLSRIIRWFKGRTTFESRKIQPDFAWQPRFYDHIIRNQDALWRITNYIRNNPANWQCDKLNGR